MRERIISLAIVAALTWAGPAAAQTCDGFCGGYSEDFSCACDAACFGVGDCCDDVCDFCVDDFPAECGVVCDPTQTCVELGLTCGFHPECIWDTDFCGVCEDGLYCNQGTCEDNPCEDPDDIPGCDGVTCVLATWIGDGYCDDDLYCAETGWDGGDCEPCTKDCTGLVCGPDPVCGMSCGVCEDGSWCDEGVCLGCSCGDAECGVDECGQSCGECADGLYCNQGTCEDNPCEAPDDIPACEGYDCVPDWWAGDGYCDAALNCPETGWDAGDCEPCTKDCTGLACGLDPVCGMSCGVCEDGSWCDEGVCLECSCDGLECGFDECGNPCGECADGFGCEDHVCVEQTCVGSCGGLGLGGCWCDAICFSNGDCCPDICDECPDVDPDMCACVPDCDGKECGSDGCWSTCGVCEDGEFCAEDGLCEDCIPDCTGLKCGPDPVCGTECGPCGDGQICNAGVCEDCTADCTGLECGPDPVCGFECGPCGDGFTCDAGTCIEDACVPDCTNLECGPDPVCGTECGPCDEGFSCDASACVEDAPDCDTVCAGHCGDFAACDCGVCDAGYECLENVCEFIIGVDDVITGEDVLVGEDASDTLAGEDTTGGSGGGSSDGGCTTTTTTNSSPMAGFLVFFALMGLAVIRRVHA